MVISPMTLPLRLREDKDAMVLVMIPTVVIKWEEEDELFENCRIESDD